MCAASFARPKRDDIATNYFSDSGPLKQFGICVPTVSMCLSQAKYLARACEGFRGETRSAAV